jgi:hypothetical protein
VWSPSYNSAHVWTRDLGFSGKHTNHYTTDDALQCGLRHITLPMFEPATLGPVASTLTIRRPRRHVTSYSPALGTWDLIFICGYIVQARLLFLWLQCSSIWTVSPLPLA